MDKQERQETIETAVWSLWERCLLSARSADLITGAAGVELASLPDAVRFLIGRTKAIIAEKTGEDPGYALFDVYTRIHWDWDQPTDRVFEAMLEFELEKFFKERTVN